MEGEAMNLDKSSKMLLLKLNKAGIECTLIREQRYSKDYKSIYSRYKLTFWERIEKTNKKGVTKTVNVADTYEFKTAAELVKFMLTKVNNNA